MQGSIRSRSVNVRYAPLSQVGCFNLPGEVSYCRCGQLGLNPTWALTIGELGELRNSWRLFALVDACVTTPDLISSSQFPRHRNDLISIGNLRVRSRSILRRASSSRVLARTSIHSLAQLNSISKLSNSAVGAPTIFRSGKEPHGSF